MLRMRARIRSVDERRGFNLSLEGGFLFSFCVGWSGMRFLEL